MKVYIVRRSIIIYKAFKLLESAQAYAEELKTLKTFHEDDQPWIDTTFLYE